jgi:hypothetical protein
MDINRNGSSKCGNAVGTSTKLPASTDPLKLICTWWNCQKNKIQIDPPVYPKLPGELNEAFPNVNETIPNLSNLFSANCLCKKSIQSIYPILTHSTQIPM